MKSNKMSKEANRSDFNDYFTTNKKKIEIQQVSNKISKSFDQTSESSEKNMNNDDSFYDWNQNQQLENTNINRVSSQIPQTNNGDHNGEDYSNNHLNGEYETKTPEEEKDNKSMMQKYQIQKEEPSLVSEYVVGNSPKDESSTEQISDGKDKPAQQNGNLNGNQVPLIEKRRLSSRLEIKTNENKQDHGINFEFSSQFQSSEIKALHQMRETELRKPVTLNVIIIGKTGIGKSTFIDAFLDQKFEKQDHDIRPVTVDIVERKAQRKEGDMTFNLTMVDTPGFEENTDISKWQNKIRKYITDKFDKYKKEEKRRDNSNSMNTQNIVDERVHGCLYFITGPRISQMDIDNLIMLQKYVTIIPILAKGDSFIIEEVKEIKKQLNQQAKKNNISFFDVDGLFKDQPDKYNKLKKSPFGTVPPFLIISSVKKITLKTNEVTYGREYNWGTCDIKNPEHSDFMLLYSLLIGLFSVKLVNLADLYSKAYFKELKRKKEQMQIKVEQKEKQNMLTLIAASAVGTAGYFVYKFFHKN